MDLEKLLANNLIRFGVKNLTLESKSSILTEAIEPDLSSADWSRGGSVTWDDANISDIIRYIQLRDANQPYSKFEVYKPIFNWFSEHQNLSSVRESLLIWCGDDPYYGLASSREKAKGSQYANTSSEIQKNDMLISLANDWSTKVIPTLKGTSPDDQKVAANITALAAMIKKAGESGIILKTQPSSADSFIKNQWKNLKYLPTGGYTSADALTAKKMKDNFLASLSSTSKTSNVNTEYSINIKADNVNRTKLLTSIQTQCIERIKNPQNRDSIIGRNPSIPYVIKQAEIISFNKAGTTTSAAESGGNISSAAVVRFAHSWPDNADPDGVIDAKAYNFFPDDGTTPGEQSMDGMSTVAANIYEELRNIKQKYGENYEIVSISINTFASTSTVNSSFGSGKLKQFNRTNNIKLVQQRFKNMRSAMNNYLNIQLKDETDGKGAPLLSKIVTGQELNFANAGPDWEKVGGNAYGQTYGIDAYGPLFQKAYKANPNKTPKEFYSVAARKTNPEIKKDYETTYAGYRKAMIWVEVVLRGEEITKNEGPDLVIAISGNFEAVIIWPNKKREKRAKGSKATRYSKPIGNMPKFTGRTIKCPSF